MCYFSADSRYSYISILYSSSWNCQKLAAEQPLPRQAVRTALPSLHHCTDSAKLGSMKVRASPLAFGLTVVPVYCGGGGGG
jgi:hypothetical protein